MKSAIGQAIGNANAQAPVAPVPAPQAASAPGGEQDPANDALKGIVAKKDETLAEVRVEVDVLAGMLLMLKDVVMVMAQENQEMKQVIGTLMQHVVASKGGKAPVEPVAPQGPVPPVQQ